MKRALLLVVAAFLLAGTFGGGVAVAQDTAIVSIPFQFTVTHTLMPAGKYEISVTETSVISVMPQKGAAVMAPILTRLAQHGTPVTDAEVVFDRLGDEYTLAELWLPTTDGYLVNDLKQPHQHHVLKATKKPS